MALTQFLPMDSYYHEIVAATALLETICELNDIITPSPDGGCLGVVYLALDGAAVWCCLK